MTSALVLFSGGQDSTTCLSLALKSYDKVYTMGFDYGQRNDIELICRQKIRENIEKILKIENVLQDDFLLNIRNISDVATSAYLNKEDKIEEKENSLPTSFVPGRNLIFLTYAAAKAYSLNTDNIIIGVSEADYSGYPDCRANTINAMQDAISFGLDRKINIQTPLMHLDKSQVFYKAYELGGMELIDFILEYTHTCYEGVRKIKHNFGYGCATCPACKLRQRGFENFKKLL